jgi:hypothetical protein
VLSGGSATGMYTTFIAKARVEGVVELLGTECGTLSPMVLLND